MQLKRYRALRFTQLADRGELIFFSAPCNEQIAWGGIPRKEQRQGVHTIGFQRASNPKRLKGISCFLEDPENVIANPILGAVRDATQVRFVPDEGEADSRARVGFLEIEWPDYESMTLAQLLEAVCKLLEKRWPARPEVEIEDTEVSRFISDAAEVDEQFDASEFSEDGDVQTEPEDDADKANGSELEVDFSSERHLEDFYRSVRLRQYALERLPSFTGDSIGGFSRSFLEDFLKPILIVDGQHRLLGAFRDLKSRENSDTEYIDQLVAEGKSRPEISELIASRHARTFGMSLIPNPDWAEHVFQFVVVNQKAAPIPKPLLASIIATTLTDEEISRITGRLERADIRVTDYLALNYINSWETSPFRDLIQRGYGDQGEVDKLQMTVADNLIKMFRMLKGGKLFHDPSTDYAKNWGGYRLEACEFLDDFKARGFESRLEFWSSEEGPWREFFCRFYTNIKNHMSSSDPSSGSFWGSPKTSNLFNAVYLTILGADFFQFLWNTRCQLRIRAETRVTNQRGWIA